MVRPFLLKPQDNFGEFNNFFSWSSESAGNHQKTPSDLPAIVLKDILYNAILPSGKSSLCTLHNLWQSVRGGTPNILMFWLFPENGSISERTVNRALIFKILQKFNKKIYINFRFSLVPKLFIGFNAYLQAVRSELSSSSRTVQDSSLTFPATPKNCSQNGNQRGLTLS